MAKDLNLSSQTRLLVLPLALCLFCFASRLLPQAEAVWLNIPSSGTKCVSEEIQTHVVVLADYYVVADQVEDHRLPTVSVRVYSFIFNFYYYYYYYFVSFVLRVVDLMI